jgi:hypothetical protein
MNATDQWQVFVVDPGVGRERAIDTAATFEEARAKATAANRRELEAEGMPARAPFRFFFAGCANGHMPTPAWLKELELLERTRG